MKNQTVVVLVVAGVTAIAVIALWDKSVFLRGGERGAFDSRAPTLPAPSSASPISNSTSVSEPAAERRIAAVSQERPSLDPRYAEPEEIETQLAQFFRCVTGCKRRTADSERQRLRRSEEAIN